MNTNETIELTDLEPKNEVVGGAAVQAGAGYAVLTVGGIHSAATPEATLISERESTLIYSGEPG